MNLPSQNRRVRPSEEGYMLVVVIFMLAILILSLSIAVPRVRESIQRDREEETMQRGKQYIRAIQLYYRKFNAYPPSVDALVKTNNIRFLRKKYVDPTTGKDEWKPVLFGQNKTPQAMGFFGQPLAAASGAGTGPSGNNGLPGTASSPGTTNSNGLFNSTPTSTTDPTTGATGQSGTGGTGASGGPGSGTATSGTGTSGSAISSSNDPTGNGQAFGGGGIIGFSPQGPRQSLMVYKKKNHYNEWEFLYSPLMEQQNMAGGNTGMIGQPASGTTTPIGGPGSTISPTAPTTPTTPTSPQQ
jgi:type II secretory pathway pseudopilin PulG